MNKYERIQTNMNKYQQIARYQQTNINKYEQI